MKLEVTGPYIYGTLPVLGGIDVTQTMVSSLVVTVALCLACVVLGRDLKKRPGRRQALVEQGVAMLESMVVSTMGEHNAHWTPFIGTLFLSSLGGSLIGMTGFLRSATADLSCVLVWAVMVSGIIWYHSIKHLGLWGWLRGFTRPIAVMTPINLVSEIAQPLSMAFRHFGNIAGGGVITAILYAALSGASALVLGWIAGSGWLVSGAMLALGAGLLIRWKGRRQKKWLLFGLISAVIGGLGLLQGLGLVQDVPVLAVGIPAVLSVYFDLFSGFVQAYVFSLLTMVYLTGALPEKHED